ncbi:ABC transporter permease [uncultured Anaerococcus sp.]|uniref:ABC transporter permease n=1 Tax=uncultured Anaerococcus sp. TaxID=293428 RepID=UPI00280BE4B9|nr:ABC transporter permease [uncultured Anaerococcus sp.]MDU5149115.1 ABC transporter permease [Anaerococcus prevotii]
MKIRDRLEMALRNLVRRKSRTILTILSVVIGASSIILMIAFALGINQQQKDMIDSFGGLSSIQILTEGNGGTAKIDQANITKLKNIEGVKAVVPSKSFFSEILVKDDEDIKISGEIQVVPDDVIENISKDMMEWGDRIGKADDDKIILGSQLSAGKMVKESYGFSQEPIEDFDFKTHEYILRLGYKEMDDDGVNFTNENEENGEEKKADYIDIPVQVTGKMNSKAFISPWASVINESFYKKLKKEDKKLTNSQLNQNFDMDGKPIEEKAGSEIAYDNLKVVVEDVENLPQVEESIRKAGFDTQSEAGSAEEIKKSNMVVTMILGGIGSVAFIVSAIGIINTMLMSIYERQKEIGVMKVIGASVDDVRSMFLIESGFIGFFGGIVGLIISLIVGLAINSLAANSGFFGSMNGEASKIIIIPIWLSLVGVGFSSMVGVLAGYIPARRATRLSAIEALRSN